MIKKENLRKADFVFSIILILLGAWICTQAAKMPMRDTYAGVENVWYVSPALFPFIIGFGKIVLGLILLLHSTRTGGAKELLASFSLRLSKMSDRSLRLVAMFVMLFSFVYVYAPRIDFFISVMSFLFAFVSIFYLYDRTLLKQLTLFYLIGVLLISALFMLGIATYLNRLFVYSTDVLSLLFFFSYYGYCRYKVRKNNEYLKKLRTTLVVALVAPTVLCPLFKYLLLVPLPKEGGIIELFNIARYSIL